MAKLPMEERPPFEEIQRRLFDRVSAQYRQLFVEDVQNDCACDVETYERDPEYDTWYLTAPDKVEKILFGDRISCPMLPDISDKSILLLLQKACENIGDTPTTDTIPRALLTNHQSTGDKIVHIMEKVLHRGISMNRSGLCYGLAYADFLPIDEFVLFPEPEFFGAITNNIGGYGAFCFSNPLFKYKV
jgi:hypothetical protein